MRLAGILNIDQISVLVLEVLVNTLGYKISAVQLIDEEKKNLRFQIINAPKIVLRLVKRFLGFSPSDVKIPLTERKSYLVQSFLEKRITKSNDLYFFNCPVVSARVTKITQKIMRLRDIVAVPLMIKGEPIGVLSVGSSKEISDSELEFFKTFANQIAIALYNAKLLDEQKGAIRGAPSRLQKVGRIAPIAELGSGQERIYPRGLPPIPYPFVRYPL